MFKNIFLIYLCILFIDKTYCCIDCNTIIGKVNVAEYNTQRLNQVSVSLEASSRAAFLNDEGVFIFHNVPSGVYILNVNDILYQYEQIYIEVTPTEIKAFQNHIKNGKGLKHKIPFEINPLTKIKYIEDSPNIVAGLIKSPYVIIIGVTVLLVLCMNMMPQDQIKETFDQMNQQFGQMQNLMKNK